MLNNSAETLRMSCRARAFGKAGILLVSTLFLFGCAATGENLQSNVYKAGQVNTAQAAKVVNILAVMPAKIEVDNAQQKKEAEVVGGLLGAIGGGVIGNTTTNHSAGGTLLGGAAGGVGGAALGSLVSDKVLVDGVSLTYEADGKTLNSAQVGKLCEFHPGKAIMISTSPMETRIQPNATCPPPAANKN